MSVYQRFFEPVRLALGRAKYTRSCQIFSDEQFLLSGLLRVIEPVQSGRDWIQQLLSRTKIPLSVGNFFEALKSPRRLLLTQEVALTIRQQVDQVAADRDPLKVHDELNPMAVYAADGHYHARASHDLKQGTRAEPVGHFFALNLRTHTLHHLDVARPEYKREHDITALKRLDAAELRMGEPKGRKVILVYDKAGIDFRAWYRWKQSKGLYMISREKDNMELDVVGNNPWDEQDLRNQGVLSDELVGAPILLRRIRYQDASTGKVYRFLTNEMTLPPGLICWLYQQRWAIEKVFDELKNKLAEQKAWASSYTAKAQQAVLLCLVHNLMVNLEDALDREERITDIKVLHKQMRRRKKLEKQLAEQGKTLNPLVRSLQRSTQRSLQFIRWLRIVLREFTSWEIAVEDLRPLMNKYL